MAAAELARRVGVSEGETAAGDVVSNDAQDSAVTRAACIPVKGIAVPLGVAVEVPEKAPQARIRSAVRVTGVPQAPLYVEGDSRADARGGGAGFVERLP
jgi:hypothetical protein